MSINIQLQPNQKVYFASDFHLGVPDKEGSLVRERKIIRWLDEIKHDAGHIFLVGDIFDFWYEYRQVIPKGFIRFQGKLAELRDMGIPISFFSGNHDIWLFDYFTEELGIPIYRRNQEVRINNLKIELGHGDGLGPGDYTYKFLQKLFESKTCQFLFSRLHPNMALWFGYTWSMSRKKKKNIRVSPIKSKENELLWLYAREVESKNHHDYYIFGHRHLPLNLEVAENSRYVNLGEWMWSYTYGVCDGETVELRTFEKNDLEKANTNKARTQQGKQD
ncbi:MAG: UDP-2,3-diacylglucosamine hydrolase [Flammeovirgaceae bacterium]|jgi:UDP-2,3-diacylglucosamine hydrolase